MTTTTPAAASAKRAPARKTAARKTTAAKTTTATGKRHTSTARARRGASATQEIIDEGPVVLAAPSVAVQLLDLPIGQIRQHPRNPRRAVGDVTELAESVRAHGILEPLVVAPSGDDPTVWLLIAGHRRLAAAQLAGLDTVPALHRAGLDTEARQIEAMLVENLHRADLTPVEEAAAYQGLLDLGLTQTAVAAGTGQPVSRVRDRLKLNRVPKPVQAKLHVGQITITDALALLEFEGAQSLVKTLTKSLGTSEFRRELELARQDVAHDKNVDARIKTLTAKGVTISSTAPKGGVRIDLPTYYDGLPLAALAIGNNPEDRKLDTWVIDHHAHCPGHVTTALTRDRSYYNYRSRREIAHWCTTPKAHPNAKKTAKSPEQLKREQKEAAARKEIRAEAAGAATLRSEHLHEQLLRHQATDVQPRMVALVMARLDGAMAYTAGERALQLKALADVFGFELPQKEGRAKVELGDIRENVHAVVKILSLAQLVFALDFMDNLRSEAAVSDESPYAGGASSRGHTWLTILRDHYGYAPTSWEVKRFALVDPATAGTSIDPADKCTSCGEFVEDIGVVDGHPTECSLCAEADLDDDGGQA